MPDLQRAKFTAETKTEAHPMGTDVYNTTADWYKNDGTIHYVAYAITERGGAVRIRPAEAGAAGSGSALNHPDQMYWKAVSSDRIKTIVTQHGKILRVEIDCTLMPCAAGPVCCLIQVPRRITAIGLPGTPLRIFSHRDENLGRRTQPGLGVVGSGNSKRYFDCNSSDAEKTLSDKMAGHTGWSWNSKA